MSTSQIRNGSSDYSQFTNQLQSQQFGESNSYEDISQLFNGKSKTIQTHKPRSKLVSNKIISQQQLPSLPSEVQAAIGQNKENNDQVFIPFQTSLSIYNIINHTSQNDIYHDVTTRNRNHTTSTNLFSQKFKDSTVSSVDLLHHNSSNYSQNQTRAYCSQHPNKKVKYILSHVTKVQACSKCAVQYAMEKNQLKQIQSQLDDKKKQTDSFLGQLNQTKTSIEQFIDILKNKEINLKEFYDIQFQNVVNYYLQIEQKMQQTKQAILQELTEHQWKSLEQINQNRVQCKQLNHTLVSFLKDIQHNYENIVKKVETLPFNQIMGGYSSKLHKLQKFFTKIRQEKVEQIEFIGMNGQILKELEQQLQNLVSQSLSQKTKNQTKKSETRCSSEQMRRQRNYFYLLKSQESEKRHSSQPIMQSVQ